MKRTISDKDLLFLAFAMLATFLVFSCTPSKSSTVMDNDFVVINESHFENTAKVLAPGDDNDCILGKITVVCGQTRPGKVVIRDLYTSSGQIDVASTPVSVTIPYDASTEAIATDNQIIRLKDGGFMMMKNSYTWETLSPKPDWWNTDITMSSPGTIVHKGARNAIYFWKSKDCGKTWTAVSKIDAGKVLNGKYAWPQPGSTAGTWGVGGFDRSEIYQDPWNGRIYVSGHGDAGPFEVSGNTKEHHNEVIFYSDDEGKNWNVIKEIDKGAPFVMTSTPNGRFYAFSSSGGEPKLYYTTNPGDPMSLNGGKTVYYNADNTKTATVDNNAHILRSIQQNSISRASYDNTSSEVRLAYSGVNSNGRQIYYLQHARINDATPSNAPTITPTKIIEGADKAKYSVTLGSFVDVDYLGIPSNKHSNKTIFYWVETSTGANPVKNSAKYVLLYNGFGFTSDAAFLSKSNNAARYWTTTSGIGDYFSGGFFWSNNELHYLCQWNESDGIHANIVTVKKL
jgi:hypothetical protein